MPRWREASLLHFTLEVHHVMRVGHLESLMAWRSLLYLSPARLPLAWGITQLPLSMPHDLPAAELVDSAKWLVRALLTEHREPCTHHCQSGPSMGRRCPVVANLLAGFRRAQRKFLSGSLTGLLSIQLDRAVTYTSLLWLSGCFSPLLTHKDRTHRPRCIRCRQDAVRCALSCLLCAARAPGLLCCPREHHHCRNGHLCPAAVATRT